MNVQRRESPLRHADGTGISSIPRECSPRTPKTNPKESFPSFSVLCDLNETGMGLPTINDTPTEGIERWFVVRLVEIRDLIRLLQSKTFFSGDVIFSNGIETTARGRTTVLGGTA